MREIRRVAVLGAGNMGRGIAQACAQAGLSVVVRDVKDDLVQKGLQRIRADLERRVAKGKIAQLEAAAVAARVSGTTAVAEAVAQADLVVEAVFEDLKVKKEVFAEVDRAARPEAILATNTSSLSVTELARSTRHPERFAGLHFFNPAAVNLLVEVVAGEKTAPATIDALLRVSRELGKTPIRVADSPGFAVNRFFVPFLNEACRLVDEGLSFPTVEAAAKEAFGIGMGPFELMNFTGIPIAFHAQESLHRGLGEFYRPSALLKKQFEAGQPWNLDGAPDPSTVPAARDRFLGVCFAIAASLVEETVATPGDVDKGATVGLRWKRGPFAMMNEATTKRALALVEAASRHHGGKLPVARNLRALAETRGSAAGEPWRIPKVRYEAGEGVAVVTIDRPEARNALNAEVLSDLAAALARAEADDTVRCVVLTGEGPAFVAGADIAVMAEVTPAQAREYTKLGQDTFRRVERMEKPVIAAVNGFAFGGGCELAIACDVILASEKAQFGLPEVGLGIHPGFGGTQRLPRLVGRHVAKELILSGDTFDARRAAEIRLVNRVVPHARLLDEALALARRIAQNAPYAVRLAKAAVNRGADLPLDAALALELESVTTTFATEDRTEGMRAFLEKRKPEWKGK
ncbi:MAG TPA: enoyl-CoA hydratase-related protein [Candidatus Thermoplasmatota archaeon]|nr:enoyl-CoA hydratase-related protein [Candidatus Thermoplasmatota archaeon]